MPKILKPDSVIRALENFSIYPYQSATPLLCVLMKDDATKDNESYLKSIIKCADKYGCSVKTNIVSNMIEAITVMTRIRSEMSCNGILLLGDFGKNENAALAGMIPPRVDVDCVSSTMYGLFATSSSKVAYRDAPCTAVACYKILEYEKYKIQGASIGIVGRSLKVGRPLAEILTSKDATTTIYNSHSNLSTLKFHDVVVVATGQPKLIRGDLLRKGQWVIDVGINMKDGKLCGDVDFESACEAIGDEGAITPVPGGVGPLTNAVLFSKLFYNAYMEQNGGIV